MSSGDLDSFLLALEDRLRSLRAPVVDSLQAGLSEPDVRAALTTENLPAPEELLRWWGWHNGTNVPPTQNRLGVLQVPENTLFDSFHLMALEESLATRQWYRELYEPLVPPGYSIDWIPLLLSDTGLYFCADTAAGGRHVPIHLFDPAVVDYRPPPTFDSLTSLVALFVRLFDDGIVRPNPTDPRLPSLDRASLPEYVRRLGIW
jgi:hypothetical protein